MALKIATLNMNKLSLFIINNKMKTIIFPNSIFRNYLSNTSQLMNENSLVLFKNRTITQRCNGKSPESISTYYLGSIIGNSSLNITSNTTSLLLSSLSTSYHQYNSNTKRYYSIDNKKPESSRSSSNDDNKTEHSRKRSLPQLMEFPEIVWPSIIKSIKNWILITFIIRPYFDREFNLPDFVTGTKHALQVSNLNWKEFLFIFFY